MTTSEYERIREKISKANENNIRAKGAADRILEQLKSDYSISSIKECEDRIKELAEEIKQHSIEKNSYIEELENAVDWDSI